jgi:hypothetical protein
LREKSGAIDHPKALRKHYEFLTWVHNMLGLQSDSHPHPVDTDCRDNLAPARLLYAHI